MVKEGKARQRSVPPTPLRVPPPEESLSHLEGRFFVVVRPPNNGTGLQPGIYHPPCPPLVVSRPTSGVFKFPVVVVCATLEQAQDVNQLNEGIAEVGRKRTATSRITAFRALVDDQFLLGGSSRRWYGAWLVESALGSVYRTIFAEYRDYRSIVDAAEVADGRQHRRFEDIRNAMTWFLAEGDSDILRNNPSWTQYLPAADRRRAFDTPDTEVRAIDPTIINLTDDEDEPEEGFLPSLESPSVSVTRGGRRAQWEMPAFGDAQPSPFTPVHPRTPYEHRFTPSSTPTRAAPSHARATSPSASRVPPHCFTPASPPPASSASARPTVQFQRFGSAGPSVSAGPSTSRQHLATTSTAPMGQGVSSSSTHTARRGGFRPASLSMPHAMVDYLRAHNYEYYDISCIDTAWIACAGNVDGFVSALVTLGFEDGPARYLWSLQGAQR